MGEKIIKATKYILSCILDIIYAEEDKCISCGDILTSDKRLCNSCYNKVQLCKEPMLVKNQNIKFKSHSYSYYCGVIKDLIIKLKYKSNFPAGSVLAEMLYSYIVKNDLKFDFITFVPSSKASLKRRGYNQSKYLAKKLSEKTDKSIINVLYKSFETKDQIGLDEESRWNNLKGSFKVRKSKYILDRVILLIDDVITTGSTTYYCREELIKQGAREVIILTVARGKI